VDDPELLAQWTGKA